MSRKNQKVKPETSPLVTVTLDFGGSATKGVYALVGGEAQILCMEPEVATVSMDSIKSYSQNKLGSADPENVCWVSVKDSTRAVGYLAATRYYANPGLAELKYERGLYKTLAAVWVIKEKLKLPSTFRVALAILLPPGEFENKRRFEQLVREALLDYLTPTGRCSVELVMFNCKPEGAGIYLMHQKKIGAPLKRRVCALVMIGYRNASLLVSDRGVVEEGKTSDLGFVRLVEKVVAATSGQTLSRLTPAIAAAGAEVDSRVLQRLTRSKTREGRAEEVQQMIQAIKLARVEYTLTLTSWLDNVLPDPVDEIVFCGGTVDYLMKELNDHYCKTPLSWSAGIAIPGTLDTLGLGTRLCDVYSLFLYFHSLVEKQFGASNESAYQVVSHEIQV